MSGTAVKFSWLEPFSGGDGIPLTEYELNVFNVQTNSFFSSPISIPTLSLEYDIEMTDLVGPSSIYKYSEGDLIKAKVRARNAKDFGDYSDANTFGVLGQVKPHSPVNGPTRGG